MAMAWLKGKWKECCTRKMDTEEVTGEDIIFIYPDMILTGSGTVRERGAVSGSAVDIIGERCNEGHKEIEVRPAHHDPSCRLKKEEGLEMCGPPHELGQHPTVMDPMERKNVYTSVFLNRLQTRTVCIRKNFRAGDLVSSRARGRCQTSCLST